MKASAYVKNIRSAVMGIVRNGDKILIAEGYDSVKKEVFFRPLGGGIEFGEKGADALKREILEELKLEINDIKYKNLIENIFTWEGSRGHELVLVYGFSFSDNSVYNNEHFEIYDIKDENVKVYWKHISDFKTKNDILYPVGLLELL